MRATEVASAAPQKSYHAMRSMLIGALARAVSTVMKAGAQTMFCTCIAWDQCEPLSIMTAAYGH